MTTNLSTNLKLGENKCTNEEYHADRKFFSSSVLKELLKNKRQFYNKYILGYTVEENKPKNAFLLGSLVHSMILEPELVNDEYAFLPESIKSRRGEVFRNFMAQPENEGKASILASQKRVADRMVDIYDNKPEAVGLIKNGEPEKTLCVELHGLPIKVRADYVNIEKGYIVDVKTTSDGTDVESVKNTSEKYGYMLSAALYLMAFNKHHKKKFDFYWIYLGKFTNTCDVYKMSLDSMKKGIDQVKDAITIYKKNVENNSWLEYDILEI